MEELIEMFVIPDELCFTRDIAHKLIFHNTSIITVNIFF